MDRVDHWLREASRGMSPDAVLAQPVSQLQGVGDAAAGALADAGIRSILDLAASALFSVARHVVEAADGEGPLALLPLPSDLIDDSALGQSAAEISRCELFVLRPVDPPLALRLQSDLPAPTVRDLALWPPALNARRLLQIAYGGEDAAEDPEAPFELRPRMGRLPVERVQYEQLYFEGLLEDLGDGSDIGRGAPEQLQILKGVEWPVDLTDALIGRGFDRPGLGLRVTIGQSWTPIGLALGHLLHSLALAPGEATRLAVVDWTRRVAGGTAEDIAEDEALSNSLTRQRSVTEVIDVVAKEVQKGNSGFTMTGAGWGIGGAVAGGVNSGDKQGAAALGFGYNRNDAQGSAMASSQGQRDVGSKLSQFVQDRSEQAASMARGRRASVVTEVSVGEAEHLSTRVVANYNHMHALSVLYFEVVQVYRLLTEVARVEPLLYLPVRPFSFDNVGLVERYRGVLAEVALTPEARNALLGVPPAPSAVEKSPNGTMHLILTGLANAQRPVQGNLPLDEAGLRSALGKNAAWSSPTELQLHTQEAALVEVQVGGWYNLSGQPMGPALGNLIRIGTQGMESFGFKAWAQSRDKRYALSPGQSDTPFAVAFANDGLRLETLRSLSVSALGGLGKNNLDVELVFKRVDPRGRPVGDPVTLRAFLATDGLASDITLLNTKFKPDAAEEPPKPPPFDLVAHLEANALHYTMALLQRADPAVLGLFLGRIQYAGQALLSQVDPKPIAHVGNYLVFRWPVVAEAPWWRRLLNARGLPGASRQENLVPMPTGGVFAEAVLGRFNSAEKLDLSRFWNWQDSPIPFPPPEIAPLQAGQRQGAATPTINPLGAAQLQQMQPLVIPNFSDAVGKAAEIAGKGDSFRDMSGVNSLLQQGGSAMTLAAQGAREFMAKAMDTVSAYGARVNEGKKIDDDKAGAAKQAAPANKGTAGATPAPGPGTPGVAPGDSGTPGSGQGGGHPSGTGKAASPAANPPSKREEAFSGPQPTVPATTSEAAAEPGTLRMFVTVLPPDPKKKQIVNLSGRLELAGPVAVEVPDGFWTVQIDAGVGQTSGRRKDTQRSTLSGNLNVGSIGAAQWEVAPGLQVPGLPAGWLGNLWSDLERMGSFNLVPVNGVVLPSGRGDVEIDLELRLELASQLGVVRMLQMLGTEDADTDNLFPGAFTLSIASRFSGATATTAELDTLTKELGDKLSAHRREAVAFIHRWRDTEVFWPIIGASISYDPGTQLLTVAPRWALISDPTLAIKEAG